MTTETEQEKFIPDNEEARRKDEIYEAAKKRLPSENVISLHSFPYEESLEDLRSLDGWKDSEELIEKTEKLVAQIREKEAEEEKARSEYLKKRKKRRMTALFVLLGSLALAALYFFVLRSEFGLIRARILINNGNYTKAFSILKDMKNDRSEALLREMIPLYKKQLFEEAEIGGRIIFGTFEQDNNEMNGREYLEWQILDKKDGRILLISRYGIDCWPFDYKNMRSNWEKSTLRMWLNSEFYEDSFTDYEKRMIAETLVTAEGNPNWDADPGPDTVDKVFILSISEAERYFDSPEARSCQLTAYSRAYGAYQSDNRTCWWWLRNPGSSTQKACFVIAAGYISVDGERVSAYRTTVRPAMWLTLEEN